MTKQLTLNCDMGEGFGPWEMGDDKAIMPLIDAANIACGGHAGDPSTMRHCVELAKRHKTEIGAHVSYPDKQGFGRRAMDLRGQELVDLMLYQIGALDGIARAYGSRVNLRQATWRAVSRHAGRPGHHERHHEGRVLLARGPRTGGVGDPERP